MDVAIGYQIAKNVSLHATLVNVFNQCFGGSNVPWNNEGPKVACWYTTGNYARNFYNPGNTFQGPSEQYPYAPSVPRQSNRTLSRGSFRPVAYGGQANPFQAYLSLNVTL